jgi:hypothetical protein
VLDREGYMNNYTLTFSYTPGDQFILNIDKFDEASKVKDCHVNKNDMIGTI